MRCGRLSVVSVLLGIVCLVEPAGAADRPRLLGLDQIYFQEGWGRRIPDGELTLLLPPEATTRFPETVTSNNDDMNLCSVRDFIIPLAGQPSERFLRQVRLHGFRTEEIWWALYLGQERTDLWYYRSGVFDNKFLANYDLRDVQAGGSDHLVLTIWKSSYRPAGAFQLGEMDIHLRTEGSDLVFAYVVDSFTLATGYDDGGSPPPVFFSSESDSQGTIIIATLDSIPDAVLETCGYEHPMGLEVAVDDAGFFRRVASCLRLRPEVVVTSRDPRTPAWVQRDPH